MNLEGDVEFELSIGKLILNFTASRLGVCGQKHK